MSNLQPQSKFVELPLADILAAMSAEHAELLTAKLAFIAINGYGTRRMHEHMQDILDWKYSTQVTNSAFLIMCREYDRHAGRPVSRRAEPRSSIRRLAANKDTDGPFAIDHVQPLSRGGSNNPANLVVACRSCNSSKRALLLTEWRGPWHRQRAFGGRW